MYKDIDNVSKFEESRQKVKEGKIDHEEHFIRSLTFLLTSSEDEIEDIRKNFENEMENLVNKKRENKIKGPEFSKKFGGLVEEYNSLGVIGTELEESVPKMLEDLDDLPEDEVLEKGINEYSNEDQIGTFYHSYLCYLHLNKDIKGTSARQRACKKISDKLDSEEEIKLWEEELPEAPERTLDSYLS